MSRAEQFLQTLRTAKKIGDIDEPNLIIAIKEASDNKDSKLLKKLLAEYETACMRLNAEACSQYPIVLLNHIRLEFIIAAYYADYPDFYCSEPSERASHWFEDIQQAYSNPSEYGRVMRMAKILFKEKGIVVSRYIKRFGVISL